MPNRRPLMLVLMAALAGLALGIAATPCRDEDEPRLAAIARTMAESGDWIVPMRNDDPAIDKPVFTPRAMAAASLPLGTSEIVAGLPAAIATLLTARPLVRAGVRWFDATTGMVAAPAFVGCPLGGTTIPATDRLAASRGAAGSPAGEDGQPHRNPGGTTR